MGKNRKGIETHPDLNSALRGIIPVDKTYEIVWHNLKAGEKIRAHYHEVAREWIIATQGKFKVIIDGVVCIFNLTYKKKLSIFIPLPRKSIHSLIAQTDISYFVVRDKKDRINYPKRKKERRMP